MRNVQGEGPPDHKQSKSDAGNYSTIIATLYI